MAKTKKAFRGGNPHYQSEIPRLKDLYKSMIQNKRVKAAFSHLDTLPYNPKYN
jgi:hypothetical protein